MCNAHVIAFYADMAGWCYSHGSLITGRSYSGLVESELIAAVVLH